MSCENHQQLYDDKAICDRCGASGAFHLGDQFFCQDCYQAKASCCPEFGADDLWTAQQD